MRKFISFVVVSAFLLASRPAHAKEVDVTKQRAAIGVAALSVVVCPAVRNAVLSGGKATAKVSKNVVKNTGKGLLKAVTSIPKLGK